MTDSYFPLRPNTTPMIYAYSDSRPELKGLLKIGQTGGDPLKRIAQQYPIKQPVQPWKLELADSAMRADGNAFSDHNVHQYLRRRGKQQVAGEWYRCSVEDVKAAIIALQTGTENEEQRTATFGMRPEQQEAVERTATYFRNQRQRNNGKPPHFLWNAKMRFGKTFATYQLAKKMGWQRVLVLTFKPAVQSAWESDLQTHADFDGWQFVSRGGLNYEECDKTRPIVCFGSFQDYLGKNRSTGGVKTKNEWVHETPWDCVVLDEYHFGAWNENSKELFAAEDEAERAAMGGLSQELMDEDILPISTNAYLYLSGTPFRAIATGEFIEEQIYNWTYSDEQRAKSAWQGPDPNPYAALPRMIMMTYQLPKRIIELASKGQFNEFDLNTFFEAKGRGATAQFTYKDDVQKWLDLIRGEDLLRNEEDLKTGRKDRPPLPFKDTRLLNVLTHTFWFLPSVAACHAMNNLLKERQNDFFRDYEIVVAAGTEAGIGVNALPPVERAMGDPLKTKSITLSCGKLTTGVTVKPWSGIFMLRNSSSPETYFQAAFRVQSPWTTPDPDKPNEHIIWKENCYVFDFAPNRALRLLADYATNLSTDNRPTVDKVGEFVSFLPVLAYDGGSMKSISPSEILDIATSGTSATLLARRWESALLVNVDDDTLRRLMNNTDAMEAIMNIEGFRSLGSEIFEKIVNKSEAVKKAKKEANDEDLEPRQKKVLSDEEKELKSLRKQVQEKLIKFAARIPIFMYLTDKREYALIDVIQNLEPGLFKTVTGLTTQDFELLRSLGVFNGAHMNDAVGKFRAYEDASLEYMGINKHEGEAVGLWNTTLTGEEFGRTFMEESLTYDEN